MRRLILAVVVVSAVLVVALVTTAANQQPYYREPDGSTMILWDSRADERTTVPRPDNVAVTAFLKKFDRKMDEAAILRQIQSLTSPITISLWCTHRHFRTLAP